MAWRSYVAVGDSFTEGLDDPHPETGVFRGWADLVAEALASDDRPTSATPTSPSAAASSTTSSTSRCRPTLRMQPDLISFAAGGNDALRRGFEPEPLLARFEQVVGMLRASGADVIVFRFADVTSRLPGQRMILPRVQLLNRTVGDVADKHGAHLVDLWQDNEFLNPALWSVDRLHMNALGPPAGRRARADARSAQTPDADLVRRSTGTRRGCPGRRLGPPTPAGPESTWRRG